MIAVVLASVGLALLILGLLWLGFGFWLLRFDKMKLEPRNGEPKVAVLIPARDESRVIAGLLESISRQTTKVEMKNVYVIVEQLDDPTVEICGRFGSQVIIRENLDHQRKGYALDEAVKQILPQHYDAYFIFDADNVVAEDYFERMIESYRRGYDMATGYRCSKNANDHVIATMSGLTFSIINLLGNHFRIRQGANVIFSGTGCFVSGRLVEEWGGWPFHSLTEDYEMSLYAIWCGVPTFYNESAMFYDEQPTTYRQTVLQRLRWIRGYFEARKEYIPKLRSPRSVRNFGSVKHEMIGIKPYVMMLTGVFLILIAGIAGGFMGIPGWAVVVTVLVALYVVLLVLTVILLLRDRLELRPKILMETLFLNPLFLLTYIWCVVKALLAKEVKWEKIEHGVKEGDER